MTKLTYCETAMLRFGLIMLFSVLFAAAAMTADVTPPPLTYYVTINRVVTMNGTLIEGDCGPIESVTGVVVLVYQKNAQGQYVPFDSDTVAPDNLGWAAGFTLPAGQYFAHAYLNGDQAHSNDYYFTVN